MTLQIIWSVKDGAQITSKFKTAQLKRSRVQTALQPTCMLGVEHTVTWRWLSGDSQMSLKKDCHNKTKMQ